MPASLSTRWLIVIGALFAAAVVAGAAIAIMVDSEQEFAADSPEWTVQRYLRAVSDRDATGALALLSAGLEERCGGEPREAITRRRDRDLRVTLDETVETGDGTEVRVRITEFYGDPPFGGGESSHYQTFVLGREDGEWRFVEPPWPLYCPRPLPAPTDRR